MGNIFRSFELITYNCHYTHVSVHIQAQAHTHITAGFSEDVCTGLMVYMCTGGHKYYVHTHVCKH